MKIEVKNQSGKAVGSIDLDDSVFAAEVHEHILWEVVKWQLAKRRAGTASTKRFGEVRGSGKKIWKQKGTGQARHGARKAPIFVGGGSVKGPKPRSYDYQLPKRTRKLALRAALSLRASEHKLVVVDQLDVKGPKQLSKQVAATLATLGGRDGKTLVVDAKTNTNLVRGAQNLARSQWLAPEGLNVYDILRHDTLVLTQAAAKAVEGALKEQADA